MFTQDTLGVSCRECWDRLANVGMVPTPSRQIEVRVPKLDEQTLDTVIAAITGGASLDVASALADVPKEVFRHWLELGVRLASSDIKYLTEDEDRLLRFATRVRGALAQFEKNLVDRIVHAGQLSKHWQANAWLLEKRVPEVYGKKAELVAKVETAGQTFDPTKLSDEQLRQLDELLSQATNTIDITPKAQEVLSAGSEE